MDTEDRDHFKTIAAAQVGLPLDSPTPQTVENSPLRPSPAYCLRRAKTMFGCYRKDEAHDPEIYCAAVAATLEQFPQAVVDYATDPRTGIPSESKWLPNVAEVREFCISAAKRMENLAKPAIKRSTRRYDPLPPPRHWNLFVGNDIPGYEKMVERAEQSAPEYYQVERNYKGTKRVGIWVPDQWWHERHGKTKRPEAELKPLVVSEELARQLNPGAFVNQPMESEAP